MSEAAEVLKESQERAEEAVEKGRGKMAVFAGVIALLGLIAGLFVEHTTLEIHLLSNRTNDTWMQYDTLKVQTHVDDLSIKLLKPQVGTEGGITKADMDKMVEDYARHVKELPKLKDEAMHLDGETKTAVRNLMILSIAAVLASFGIVVLSMAMVSGKRWLVWKSILSALGAAGLLAYGLYSLFVLV